MADVLSATERSRRMASVRHSHTAPELSLRRGLHRLGLRYVICDERLPGRPDLVLPARKTAVFVHGCFWHGHGCRMARLPKSNNEFWMRKRIDNKLRDKRKERALRALDWHVFTVWECQLKTAAARQVTVERLYRRIRRLG